MKIVLTEIELQEAINAYLRGIYDTELEKCGVYVEYLPWSPGYDFEIELREI